MIDTHNNISVGLSTLLILYIVQTLRSISDYFNMLQISERMMKALEPLDLSTFNELTILHPTLVNPLSSSSTECPLWFAAKEGQTEIMEIMLSLPGVDLDVADADGLTALHWAADQGHAEIVHMILDSCEVYIQVGGLLDGGQHIRNRNPANLPDFNSVDHRGDTALHRATVRGHVSVIEEMLKHSRIDLFVRDNTGHTARELAEQCGHVEAVACLVREVRR
eukprot:344015_1